MHTSIEKCDVVWGGFHKFLELIFNEENDMVQDDVTCSLNFQKYFSMKKDDMILDDVMYLHVERIKINNLKI
jgi:hypothetical protein